MKQPFLVIIPAKDGLGTSQMKCLCCKESHPLCCARIETVSELVKGFQRAHERMGCSQEKYERQRLLEEL